jgi:hypothetical protein
MQDDNSIFFSGCTLFSHTCEEWAPHTSKRAPLLCLDPLAFMSVRAKGNTPYISHVRRMHSQHPQTPEFLLYQNTETKQSVVSLSACSAGCLLLLSLRRSTTEMRVCTHSHSV